MLLSFLISICVFTGTTFASTWNSVQSDLLEFRKNPSAFMNSVPEKSLHFSKFSNEQILTHSFVEEKAQQRRACSNGNKMPSQLSPLAIPAPNDDVERLLQKPLVSKNIFELNQMSLMTGEVESLPWSGDYWPIAKGILGQRPYDKEFVPLENWKDRYDYFQSSPMYQQVQKSDKNLNLSLSPSEKYELFVGDWNSFLTQHMWLEGKAYYDDKGDVEEWMGICHGWAPASYRMMGPKKSITLKSHDQKHEVKIYPDEMKGLASYLWASSPYEAVYIGGRCNEKDPKKDENGRVTDINCFDSNPATWHLAITHRVGMDKKSFIIDATYDYEVWNQPVAAYSFTYFNLKTSEVSDDPSQAIVSLNELENDIFKNYRHSGSKKIIGVAMKVGYVVERAADQHESEPPPYSSVVWADYLYDLELDDEGNILGGEWYTNLHPDFMWTPAENAIPTSYLDQYIKQDSWKQGDPLPKTWSEASITSHYKFKQVLAPIIYRLMELAQ